MAIMDKVTSLPGTSDRYRVHPGAKKYTLKDHGFMETKSGNFQLVRSLGESISDKSAPRMKLTVSKDLSELKLSTTTANGLQTINLYKSEKYAKARENAEAVFYNLLEGKVLEKVN